MIDVQTARAILKACDPAHIVTLIEQPELFEAQVGAPAVLGLREFFVGGEVSASWLEKLRAATGPDPWRHGFFVIHRESALVIGTAAFKGAPDADGMVEIAYGIVPSYENQGYATEAARGLVEYASASEDVKIIRAHTLPEANASTHVLKKNGFAFIDEVEDPDDGPVWRWERSPKT
jgi:ribosomal-protein-alanine N-acetyltransferase